MTDAILQQLAAAYGTPTFVFDVDALQARVRAIQAVFGPDIRLCYSIKANPFLLPAMSAVTARLEYAAPANCPYARACRQRMRVSSIPASTKHLPTLPVPSQTVPEATPQNPFCRFAICRRLPARRAAVCLCCCG